MEITSVCKGRTIKTATLSGVTDKNDAVRWVLLHFGETPNSVTGWRVLESDDPGVVTVDIYID